MRLEGFNGLRNDVAPERFEPSDLLVAENVDIGDTGAVRRRGGRTLAIAGDAHSLWSGPAGTYLVIDGTLCRLHTLDEVVPLKPGVGSAPVSFAQLGERVFFTSVTGTGVIESGSVRGWGITPPPMIGATPGPGTMEAGAYVCTMTYLRADGQESGAVVGAPISTEGSLVFSALPVSSDPDVVAKTLYVSATDGGTYYEALTLDNQDTEASVVNLVGEVGLETLHLGPPPAGQLVCEHAGSMLVAVDDVLYASEAYGPELFDLFDFQPFEGRITALCSMNGGYYVGTTERTYFVSGTMDEPVCREVADYGIIEGTLVRTDARLMGLDGIGEGLVACWSSAKGVCMGLEGGALTNLTDPRYRLGNTPARGAAYIDLTQGAARYVATL